MNGVDVGALVTVGLGLVLVVVGTLLAMTGAGMVAGVAQMVATASGPLGTGWVIGVVVLAALAASPGAFVSLPGLVLILAVFWGRLRSRWAYRRWEAMREPA